MGRFKGQMESHNSCFAIIHYIRRWSNQQKLLGKQLISWIVRNHCDLTRLFTAFLPIYSNERLELQNEGCESVVLTGQIQRTKKVCQLLHHSNLSQKICNFLRVVDKKIQNR